MKKLLAIFLVLLVSLLTACGVPTAQPTLKKATANANDDKEIVVGGNGGKYEQIIRDHIAPKFKEKYGISVKYVAGLSGEILAKTELEKNAPQMDVSVLVPLDVYRASKKGLIESVSEKDYPNMKNLDNRYVGVEGMGIPMYGHVIAPAYNTKSFETHKSNTISSWNDLARPEYKDRTAIMDVGNDWGFTVLYMLSKINGGGVEDIEAGIKKAKEIASNSTTFYKNSTQAFPVFQQGAADLTVMGSNSIVQLAVENHIPMKMVVPSEGVPIQAYTATLVKNAPHKKNAQKFMNYLISEEAQKIITENYFYPVIKGVELPEKYKSIIGLKDSDPVFKPDFAKLAEIRNEATDKWNKQVVPSLDK